MNDEKEKLEYGSLNKTLSELKNPNCWVAFDQWVQSLTSEYLHCLKNISVSVSNCQIANYSFMNNHLRRCSRLMQREICWGGDAKLFTAAAWKKQTEMQPQNMSPLELQMWLSYFLNWKKNSAIDAAALDWAEHYSLFLGKLVKDSLEISNWSVSSLGRLKHPRPPHKKPNNKQKKQPRLLFSKNSRHAGLLKTLEISQLHLINQ